MLSQHLQAATAGPETLAELLYERRFVPYRPAVFDIDVALGALRVEGVLLP
jgi:hypothetical protein